MDISPLVGMQVDPKDQYLFLHMWFLLSTSSSWAIMHMWRRKKLPQKYMTGFAVGVAHQTQLNGDFLLIHR